jgi:2-oxoglutarate ferredoxin oxidoreductase subunit alpha
MHSQSSPAFHKPDSVVVKFAGDSGDGMQLTGTQFTHNAARFGNDIATFPDFPAEIRAPAGTLAGVSGFQLHFGSIEIDSPGDEVDVLVVMNAAALKLNLRSLKRSGLILADLSGFDSKNLKLSGYEQNPLEDGSLQAWSLRVFDFTKLTRESLKDLPLGGKEIDRAKNMFVLGFLYWLFNRSPESTLSFLRKRFSEKQDLLEANLRVLRAGYDFGETTETALSRIEVESSREMPAGEYRNMMGNQAVALGLTAASVNSGLRLFYGSYPITPASDILHELAKFKSLGVITFQAEDEIAAAGSALGASYGGAIGVTGTSGPGLALKGETISLAVSQELPLVIIDVQRAGPSTGMPTKTEQADLLMAVFGRHGEAPLPVLAPRSPVDCFYMAYEAVRIAIEHMTPVILLSDAYVANGSEPWLIPDTDSLPPIKAKEAKLNSEGVFQPYLRDSKLVRGWAKPGMPGFEHRIGGLEKEDVSGNISYDPANHQHMVELRAQKVALIAEDYPPTCIDLGGDTGDLLVVSWGSTYGSVRSAVKLLIQEGAQVSHLHLRYLNPLPGDLSAVFARFGKVVVAELNSGHLYKLLRMNGLLMNAELISKVMGLPFGKEELSGKLRILLNPASDE